MPPKSPNGPGFWAPSVSRPIPQTKKARNKKNKTPTADTIRAAVRSGGVEAGSYTELTPTPPVTHSLPIHLTHGAAGLPAPVLAVASPSKPKPAGKPADDAEDGRDTMVVVAADPPAATTPDATALTVADAATAVNDYKAGDEIIDEDHGFSYYLYQLMLFFKAELDASVWPILAIVLYQMFYRENHLSNKEKAAIVITPWQFFVWSVFFIQFYLIGKRSHSGDAATPMIRAGERDAPRGVAAVYLAGFTELTALFLTGLATDVTPEKPTDAIAPIVIGISLGVVQTLSFLLSDAQAAWKKYMQGRGIKNLAQQHGLQWFYNNSQKIALFLRETYGPIMGSLNAYGFCTFVLSIADKCDASDETQNWITIGLLPLLFLIYQGSAKVANDFDVNQMIQGLQQNGMDIEKKAAWLRSHNGCKKAIAKLLHGEVLTDLVKFYGGSAKTATQLALTLHAFGDGSLIERDFRVFISSFNRTQVAQRKEGTLFKFFINSPEAEVKAGTIAAPFQYGLAAVLPLIHAKAKFNTVLAEIDKDFKNEGAHLLPPPAKQPSLL